MIYQLTTLDGKVIAPSVELAKDMRSRFFGLMMRREFPEHSALLLEPCSSIHMFFMRFAIDVAFVTKDGTIKHALHSIKPWRISKVVFGARAAIELPAGTLKTFGLDTGSQVVMIELEAPQS